MLEYNNAHKVARRTHLVNELFPRVTFFLLVLLNRVQNNKHVFCLGLSIVTGSYDVVNTDNARRIAKFCTTNNSWI